MKYFTRIALAIVLLGLAMILFSECAIRKNVDTTIHVADSTHIEGVSGSVETISQKVDTTKVDSEEIVITTTTYAAPIEIGGNVYFPIAQVKEEKRVKNSQANGVTATEHDKVEMTSNDSTIVHHEDVIQTTTAVDTHAGTKRFFIAISSLFLLVCVIGIGIFYYFKTKR